MRWLTLAFSLCTAVVSAQETAPLPKGAVSKIAFGSCAKHWQAQPIWEGVLTHQPDLWIFLGDNVYADTDGTTAWLVSKESLTGDWNRLADKPEFQQARGASQVAGCRATRSGC